MKKETLELLRTIDAPHITEEEMEIFIYLAKKLYHKGMSLVDIATTVDRAIHPTSGRK